MSAIETTNAQLKKLQEEGRNLLTKEEYLKSKLEGQKRDFVQTRESGETGIVSPSLFPTIQDLAIFSFWVSYIVLFYVLGTSKDLLEGGVSRYVFLAATLGAFGIQFFSWKLAALILAASLLYYLVKSMKTFLFLLIFIILSIFIHAVIYNLF